VVRVAPNIRPDLRFAAEPDFLSVTEAEILARALARWQPSDDAAELLADRAADARSGQEFLDFFGITDARQWDPHQLWGRAIGPDRLRVPLGKTPAGKVIWLDVKEGAEGGMGPHGMMTGQTGSGKSEHLKALVLALGMLFPPSVVQFLLGDFKGEAAFAGLEYLPHVQGVVSNMETSSHKLDRMADVITGEVMRRQELVKAAGYKDVRDYEAARASTKPSLEPLPALLIIIDEFSELLKLRPDLAKVFDQVGLVGRSLWIHLLNASQRVESGKMAGLIAQQTYSIGLKVKSSAQSREAIGSPRAFEDLKRAPQGSAFLVVDDEHTRYRSFYVSAPFVEPKQQAVAGGNADGHYVEPHLFTSTATPLPADIVADDVDAGGHDDDTVDEFDVDAPTVLNVLAERIRLAGSRLEHRLWLPPLEDTDEMPIDDLVREFWSRGWRDVTTDAGLVVPYARADDPYRHRQDVVGLDLSSAGGNVAVVGATHSGKSTALRSIITMLALSHSPQRVQFYGIDLGGGTLTTLGELPHVSGFAGRGGEEKMRRVVSDIERLLRQRERSFEHTGIDLNEFRARKFSGRPGPVPDDGHGDVFLVIDNIKALQVDFTDLHDRVTSLAEGALNYGIHLVIANDQWTTIRPQILAKCGARIELRMASSVESEMGDKAAAKRVPDQPGRGLLPGGKHMLVAYPRAEDLEDVRATAAELRRAWTLRGAPAAPQLQMLPAEIAYTALRNRVTTLEPRQLLIGIGETDIDGAASVDLTSSPHFYAAGRSKSGRTTVLKTLCASIQDTYSPDQAQIVVFDPNYELADAVAPNYLAAYASSLRDIEALSRGITERLDLRRPPPGLTAQELGRWRFTGTEIFLVVDDLNLLTPPGTGQSAMFSLVAYVEVARQLGFHILAATQIERWYATGMMNKVVQAMNATGAGVLVMDGDKSEKIINDVRPGPRVPGRGELVYRKGNQLVQVALPPKVMS
jgi:DNA segregation ATPase FtsK/SpoIIIE, S-DNA-T family